MGIRRNLHAFIASLLLDGDELVGSSSASISEIIIYTSADSLAEASFGVSSGTSCAQRHQQRQTKRAARSATGTKKPPETASPPDVPEVYRQIPPRPDKPSQSAPQIEYGYGPGAEKAEPPRTDGEKKSEPPASNWPEPPAN